eukprot:scaffold4414_cov127-Amphora_coffeaeformis.AAC.1
MLNQVGPMTVVALAQKEPGYTQGTTDDDEITLNSEGSTVAPVVPRTVEECNKAAHDKYLAYLFLIGAHSLKYGSLIKTLAQSFSLGTNQYPATLAEAFAVLERHPHDATYRQHMAKKGGKLKEPPKNPHAPPHNPRTTTPPDEPVELSFAQLENRCYCCGKKGHYSTKCKDRNKPKDQWAYVNTPELKGMQQFIEGQAPQPAAAPPVAAAPASSTAAQPPAPIDWMAHQMGYLHQGQEPITDTHCFSQAVDMKKWLLLDSQSTVNLFCNPDYVENIRPANATLILTTNAGSKGIDQQADVP